MIGFERYGEVARTSFRCTACVVGDGSAAGRACVEVDAEIVGSREVGCVGRVGPDGAAREGSLSSSSMDVYTLVAGPSSSSPFTRPTAVGGWFPGLVGRRGATGGVTTGSMFRLCERGAAANDKGFGGGVGRGRFVPGAMLGAVSSIRCAECSAAWWEERRDGKDASAGASFVRLADDAGAERSWDSARRTGDVVRLNLGDDCWLAFRGGVVGGALFDAENTFADLRSANRWLRTKQHSRNFGYSAHPSSQMTTRDTVYNTAPRHAPPTIPDRVSSRSCGTSDTACGRSCARVPSPALAKECSQRRAGMTSERRGLPVRRDRLAGRMLHIVGFRRACRGTGVCRMTGGKGEGETRLVDGGVNAFFQFRCQASITFMFCFG